MCANLFLNLVSDHLHCIGSDGFLWTNPTELIWHWHAINLWSEWTEALFVRHVLGVKCHR